jgi:hypothetical protein
MEVAILVIMVACLQELILFDSSLQGSEVYISSILSVQCWQAPNCLTVHSKTQK